MTELRHIRGACALDCPDTCSWIVRVEAGEPVAGALFHDNRVRVDKSA